MWVNEYVNKMTDKITVNKDNKKRCTRTSYENHCAPKVILVPCPRAPLFVIFVDCYFVRHFVDLFIYPHQVGVPCFSVQFVKNKYKLQYN